MINFLILEVLVNGPGSMRSSTDVLDNEAWYSDISIRSGDSEEP